MASMVAQHFGPGEVRGHRACFVGHAGNQGVGDAQDKRLLRAPRSLLLAEGEDGRARGVGDLEAVEQIRLAVE